MEESNMSDDENVSEKNNVDVEKQHNENAKRLKTEEIEGGDLWKTIGENIVNSYSNMGEASTSSSSSNNCFNKSKNSKNRNYRKPSKEEESSNNESVNDVEETVEPMEDSDMNSQPEEPQESESNSIYSDMNRSNSPSVIPDSDTESEDDPPILNKPKPKHNWFIVPEITNRQLGSSSKTQCSDIFQRKCYGSLHCVQRLELMYKLEKHEGCVNSLNFHPDGNLLASGSDDLKVVIWDWKNGKPLISYDTKHRGNVFQSKFLPLSGDLHIVTCARDGQVRYAQVSALEGLRSERKLGAHRGSCHKVSVLQDQPQVVISVGEDGMVLRHDLRSGKPDKILYVNADDSQVALYSISSNPLNGNEFCVAGRDYMVRSYDQRRCSGNNTLNTYYPFKKTPRKNKLLHVTCAVYNHNGSEILASYSDEDIYLFDVNGTPSSYIHHYQGHRNGATVKGVNFFGPKSEFIVSGSDCGNIYFWERDSEAIVQWLLADDNGVVNCLEPHPQIPFLCTSGLDWDVKVWVPSYEQDPPMNGLAKTVKNNLKAARSQWAYTPDMDDTQILWMLWRQLSGHDQFRVSNRRVFHYAMESSNIDLSSESGASSTSSNNSTHSDQESDDNSDEPAGCSTS